MSIRNVLYTTVLLTAATGVSRYEDTHPRLMRSDIPDGQRITLSNAPISPQTKVLGGLSCIALGHLLRQIVDKGKKPSKPSRKS